jgi:NAD(P)-dependent dehydrogenase (short-subunit alcohol dehydrogenase family)
MKVLMGKVVLVTGASTGIGAAAARGFAAAGAVVAVHYASSAGAAAGVVADCRAAGAAAEAFRADLSRRDTAAPLIAAVAAWCGFGLLNWLAFALRARSDGRTRESQPAAPSALTVRPATFVQLSW